jgi:hypothetical protein
MLKRNIAVLIAGGLLSAQAGLAVAQSGPFPAGADQSQYWKPLPALEKYLAERAARNPNPTGAKGPVFPEGADQYQYWKPWGAQEKYFAERAARDPNPTGAGVFDDKCMENAPG